MKIILIVSIIILLFGCSKEEINGPLDIETSVMTDSRDGQEYLIVRIGKQWWMAENLNYYTPTGSWYYENDSLTFSKPFGRLFLWDTVMKGEKDNNHNPSGIRGISPPGWHIPSAKKWEQMQNYLRHFDLKGDDLKLDDVRYWSSTNPGTNKTKFNAVSCGTVYDDGKSFANIEYQVTFLTSTLSDGCGGGVIAYGLNDDNSYLHRTTVGQDNGWSMRCVKD